ncbi:hypothetical protein [Paraburkholderia fynbosensis]|nr:hypothetical protein [Paraburkholderia fynbosensis]
MNITLPMGEGEVTERVRWLYRVEPGVAHRALTFPATLADAVLTAGAAA